MSELLSLGELLIDFTPMGQSETGVALFGRNPGGAPANVAVQATRLGVSAGFVGKVGDDMFGRFLKDTLEQNGIDTKNLILDRAHATTLAFVALTDAGDRSFSFYRNPGADTQLRFDEVDLAQIDSCRLLCYGSLLMTTEPSRSTVRELVAYAKKAGKLLAYDPNWRPPLWADQEEGVRRMAEGAAFCDIIKISEEELQLITGTDELEAGARAMLDMGPALVVVTRGPDGCNLYTREFSFASHTYDTQVKDTTGSGDSFFGAFLARVVQSGKAPADLTEQELRDFADFANAAGAVCATKNGAIPALPDAAQVEACRKNIPLLVRS